MHLSELGLESHPFLKALLLLSVHVHVATALAHDLVGSLAGLVDLAACLEKVGKS